MKKRMLSAFLCLCMMLTMVPAAFATNGTTDEEPAEVTTNTTTDGTSTAGSSGTDNSGEGNEAGDEETTALERLKNAISQTDPNGTVNLTEDITIPAGPENNIVIDKAITIDGDGHTITRNFNTTQGSDGYGDYEAVFQIQSAGVTIQDVKMAGLEAGMKDEAAIYIGTITGEESAAINITGCTFSGAENDNDSYGGTGIIAAGGSSVAMNVKDNQFNNVKYAMYFNSIGSNSTISGNKIDNTSYTGIYIIPGTASGITVSRNTLTNIAQTNYNSSQFVSGIYVEGATSEGSPVTASGNTIQLSDTAIENGGVAINMDATISNIKVSPALLADTDEAGAAVVDADSYTVVPTVSQGEDSSVNVTVKITATDLKKHTNGAGVEGYWIGFALTAPEGAAKVKYDFGTDKAALSLDGKTAGDLEQNVAGNASGIAFYADAGAETPKTKAMVQWVNNEGGDIGNPVIYQMDLSDVERLVTKLKGVTVQEKSGDNTYTDSKIITAAIEDNSIVLTGLANVPAAGEQLDLKLILTTTTGQEEQDISLTSTDRVFVTDPATVTIGDTTYTVDVSGLTALPTNVEVAVAEPAVNTDGYPTGEDIPVNKDQAEAAAKSVEADGLASAAINTAQSVPEEVLTEANTALTNANITTTVEGDTAIVVVQPYLEITPTGSTSSEDNTTKTLTFDIEAKYNLVATYSSTDTSNMVTSGDGQNAVILTEEPQALDVETALEMSIDLPGDFVGEAAKLYVKHDKVGGKTYYYTGEVKDSSADSTDSSGTSTTKTLTFTNPHGFSTFTISTSNDAVATVDGIGYATYDAAVADVADNGTITILVEPSEGTKIDVGNKTITFEAVSGIVLTKDMFEGEVEVNTDGSITVKPATEPSTTPGGGGSSGGGGGGGASTSYAVSVSSSIDNGSVTVFPKNAAKGATVTITVTPDAGYELDTLTVKDASGNAIDLTRESDTTYTFEMPSGRVTVDATFAEISTTPSNPFADVASNAYYADAVLWAVENDITEGTSATTFSPNASCTRAQMVTFLWRAAGSPEPQSAENPFTDVASNAYYADAVLWAVEQGITTGTSETTFSPNATVTRGQTVTFLYRDAGSPAASAAGTFTDVAADAYYAAAVQWAVSEGVTDGMTSTTFQPDGNCTRAQIVTFLYRYLAA